MAGKAAPDTRLVAVRDLTTEQVVFVLPIDAREMIACGAYRAESIDAPAPVAVPIRTAHQDRLIEVEEVDAEGAVIAGSRRGVHAIDARELVASGVYRYAGDSSPSANGATPMIDTDALPSIDGLAALLDGVTDADVLLAMEAADDRPDAKPLYEARFNELANAPRQ